MCLGRPTAECVCEDVDPVEVHSLSYNAQRRVYLIECDHDGDDCWERAGISPDSTYRKRQDALRVMRRLDYHAHAADDARDECRWLEYGWQLGSVNHEAGCTCPACVAAIERYWQVEAERPLSLETVPDGRPF